MEAQRERTLPHPAWREETGKWGTGKPGMGDAPRLSVLEVLFRDWVYSVVMTVSEHGVILLPLTPGCWNPGNCVIICFDLDINSPSRHML